MPKFRSTGLHFGSPDSFTLTFLLIWLVLSCPSAESQEVISLDKIAAGELPDNLNNAVGLTQWRDEKAIICCTQTAIQCFDIESGQNIWKHNFGNKIKSIDVRKNKLAALTDSGSIELLSSLTGDQIFSTTLADFNVLADVKNPEQPVAQSIFIKSANELIILMYCDTFARNGRVVDIFKNRIVNSFGIEPFRTCCQLSDDGQFMGTATADQFLSICSIEKDTNVFASSDQQSSPRGNILTDDGTSYGCPFYDDRQGILIFSKRNGWENAVLIVRNVKLKSESSFEIDSGFMPMDVDFNRNRIATVTNQGKISILDFEGNLSVGVEKTINGKCNSVRFSSDGSALLLLTQKSYASYRINLKKKTFYQTEASLQNFVVNADVGGGEYSIEKFGNFAESLIQLDSRKREARLREFCKLCDSKNHHINGVIICQMLFEPQRPSLGEAKWIGKPLDRVRVLEPIVFVNSTPILAVSDYSFSGIQQTSSQFLEQCLGSRVWIKRYECPSAEQIKDDLDWYMDCFEIPQTSSDGDLSAERKFLLQQSASANTVKAEEGKPLPKSGP